MVIYIDTIAILIMAESMELAVAALIYLLQCFGFEDKKSVLTPAHAGNGFLGGLTVDSVLMELRLK